MQRVPPTGHFNQALSNLRLNDPEDDAESASPTNAMFGGDTNALFCVSAEQQPRQSIISRLYLLSGDQPPADSLPARRPLVDNESSRHRPAAAAAPRADNVLFSESQAAHRPQAGAGPSSSAAAESRPRGESAFAYAKALERFIEARNERLQAKQSEPASSYVGSKRAAGLAARQLFAGMELAGESQRFGVPELSDFARAEFGQLRAEIEASPQDEAPQRRSSFAPTYRESVAVPRPDDDFNSVRGSGPESDSDDSWKTDESGSDSEYSNALTRRIDAPRYL